MRDEIKFLQFELEKAKEKLIKFDQNESILADLFEKGVINHEG